MENKLFSGSFGNKKEQLLEAVLLVTSFAMMLVDVTHPTSTKMFMDGFIGGLGVSAFTILYYLVEYLHTEKLPSMFGWFCVFCILVVTVHLAMPAINEVISSVVQRWTELCEALADFSWRVQTAERARQYTVWYATHV